MQFLPKTYVFACPEPIRERRRIYPLFLPFSGCKVRCVFCAQVLQTGASEECVTKALARADLDFLKREEEKAEPLDLAFFGGTFTSLDKKDFHACLDFAGRWRARGQILHLRCSTRPDAVESSVLSSLKASGFDLVELGVQSFSSDALALSGRGYASDAARRGCEKVLNAGFDLGIQLMPGMPGLDNEAALRDVTEAASFAPKCARLYPCLVLEGTGLAEQWRKGNYRPWALMDTVDYLARACLSFWRAGTVVIRMGLAQETGLREGILAGPAHPGLGGMAKGLAFHLFLKEQLLAVNATDRDIDRRWRLFVPRSCQGFFWGERSGLRPLYADIGLTSDRVVWWDKDFFCLEDAAAEKKEAIPGLPGLMINP